MTGLCQRARAFTAGILLVSAALAQTTPNRIIGVVTEVSATGITLKTDAGAAVSIAFTADTRFQKVAPGEKDLSKAQTIQAADIAEGDRVLARGAAGDRTFTAQSVIVMSRSDLAQKEQRERAEWVRNGVAGLVVATDPAAKEIRVRIPSLLAEAHFVTVAFDDNTQFLHYPPDSVRFADARPSTLADIKTGDQLRARGEKSEDGARIAARQVVCGSFRTIAATVIDVTGTDVRAKDLQTGKPITISVAPEATLRRLPQFGGGMGMGMGAGRAPGAGGAAPAGGPPRAGRGPDLQQMMERLPPATLADIKPGETIVVSSARAAGDERLKAVTVLTGAEGLIAMAQARTQQQANSAGMGSWNLGDISSMMPMQ